MTKRGTYVAPLERTNRDLTFENGPTKITKVPGLPAQPPEARTK